MPSPRVNQQTKGKAGRTSPRRTPATRKQRHPTVRRPLRASHTRWIRRFRHNPAAVQFMAIAIAVGIVWLAVNCIYQVARKPSELLIPVSGIMTKTPRQTWASYAPLFRQYATRSITPELLAALAQTEGGGNPTAHTYWRWSWSLKPFQIYRPASSSVGMYQMTDGTFAEAKTLCIRAHAVLREGAWNNRNSCWFNELYFRVLPSHAVELASAYLDLETDEALARNHAIFASPQQRQHLAATVHLCGAHAGELYVRRGFRFIDGQRCADHDPRAYLARVDALMAQFGKLSQSQ